MEEWLSQLPLLLLISSRIAGVTVVSPVFRNPFVTPQLRIALTLLLGVIMLPAVPVPAGLDSDRALLVGCLLELLVGLVIGFMSQLIFAVAQMAGVMLDVDMGFAMAQVFDPVSMQSDQLLGSFFQTLSLTLYFILNGHHWLIRALAGSFEILPITGLSAGDGSCFLYVVYLFGDLLALSVQMVLPFLAVILLALAVMAGLNRAVQQMHIFQVGLGLQPVAGLTAMMFALPYFLYFLEMLFDSGHREILQTLQLLR